MHSHFHLLALYRQLLDQPRVLARLLDRFGNAERVFEHAGLIDMHECGQRDPKLVYLNDDLEKQVKHDIRWLEVPGHYLIELDDDRYPHHLKQIFDPPVVLFAKGNLAALDDRPIFVAMVGSRKATRLGLQQARNLAADLSGSGIIVVSGLALGIDAASHEGCLSVGGKTLAVLGAGCDKIYPARHHNLAERICVDGLLISEFPLGAIPYPANFPRRNRVVAGMSRATIVVEAALRSGSLISARLAAAEGREVMAMPGLVTNPQARGCHYLIKDGAALIESAADVLNELGLSEQLILPLFNASGSVESGAVEPGSVEARVLEQLTQGAMSTDSLIECVGESAQTLNVCLVNLELLGYVHASGGRFELSRSMADK